VAVAVFALAASTAPAYGAGARKPTQGSLFGGRTGETPIALPLTRTRVQAGLSGGSARVVVTQVFENPHREAIEAIYVFPLPSRAAVSGTTVRVGTRSMRGRILERRRARDAYLAAKRSGSRAVSVEQERGNVFTQSVSHIPGGATVRVELEYHVALRQTGGTFEFAFPMVVAPRSIPGAPDGRLPRGHGTAPDTDRVRDASRITPPLLPQGMRSGRDIEVSLVIDEGANLARVWSPSHPIARAALGKAQTRVALAKKRQVPNRDLVIRYRVRDDKPRVSIHRANDGTGFIGITTRVAEPGPALPAGKLRIVFLVDDSASMTGANFSAAKRVVRETLQALPTSSSFAIELVSNKRGLAMSRVSRASRAKARAFLGRLRPGRRSDARPSLRRALRKAGPGSVVFVTDGWFGNERELGRVVARERRARVFPVAIGAAPNLYFADVMAGAGRGATSSLALGEDPGRLSIEIARLVTRAPNVAAVKVSFDGAVHSVTPTRAQMFPGRAARIYARFEDGKAPRRVTMTSGSTPVTILVPRRMGSNPSLPHLWARERIKELELDSLATGASHAKVIASLGIEMGILTPYTTFLAVDEGSSSAPAARTVAVPVELPEATSRQAALADAEITSGDELDDRKFRLTNKKETSAKSGKDGRKIKKPRPRGNRSRTKTARVRRRPKQPDTATAPPEPRATEPSRVESERAPVEAAGEDAAGGASVEYDDDSAPTTRAYQSDIALAESISDESGRRIGALVGLGVARDAIETAPALTLGVGLELMRVREIAVELSLGATVPLAGDVPAIFRLIPDLTFALTRHLGLRVGAGPMLSTGAELGIDAGVALDVQLSRRLRLQLGARRSFIVSDDDVDSAAVGLEFGF